MGLSIQDRGSLDKLIDSFVNNLSNSTHPLQDKEIAQLLHVKSIEDFIFGSIYGSIIGNVNGYFSLVKHRLPNQEELKEIGDVIVKRLPEIREKIFFGK